MKLALIYRFKLKEVQQVITFACYILKARLAKFIC